MTKRPLDPQNLPVVAGPVITHDAEPGVGAPTRKRGAALKDTSLFAAQMLGGGEKRGLRGGPETLDRAKTTYLSSEYSGPHDRRPKAGIIKKTEI